MLRSLFSVSLLLCVLSAGAQNARVQKFTAPLAGGVILREVEDKYNAQVHNLEMPVPDANSDKAKLIKIKEEIARLYPHKISKSNSQNKTTSIPAPVVELGFVADSFPGIPPDNDMAISKDNRAVSVMNSSIAILDGNNGKMNYRKQLKAYSFGAGLNDMNKDYRYDPKVIYDQEADRFISIMLNSTDELNYIVIGFSRSNDPAGAWAFYKFYGNYNNDTTWFDYPSISVTKDEFFFTGNKIKFNTPWQTGFSESVIYQVKKQDGYDSAANVTYQIWDSISQKSGVFIRNLYPVKSGEQGLLGPDQYFLSNRNFDVQNDTVFLIKVPGTIASGNTNLTVTVLKSPISYGVPPVGRQPDTSATLATNDGRVLGAYAIDDEIQFVSTTLNTVNGASAIFHGKITGYKNNPVFAHAKLFSIDTLDFGYPNICFAGNSWGLNQSLISFNYTGPNMYPGLGAIMFNGTDYSPMTQIKTGNYSIKILQTKEQRWGDYSGAQRDYSQYGAMWVLGIYGRVNNSYGNWMAKISSPLLSVKETKKQVAQPVLYPNPSWHFISLDFELEKEGITNFVIYNSQGQVVDKVLEQKCKKGTNRIDFNIASLPVGTYYLKVMAADRTVLSTQSFVKQ